MSFSLLPLGEGSGMRRCQGHTVSTIRVSGWDHLIPPAYAGGTDCVNSAAVRSKVIARKHSIHDVRSGCLARTIGSVRENSINALGELKLLELLKADEESGVIRFKHRRMLIFDADAMGMLRKELVEILGFRRAPAIL